MNRGHPASETVKKAWRVIGLANRGRLSPIKGKLRFNDKYVFPDSIPSSLIDNIKLLYKQGSTKREIRSSLKIPYGLLEHCLSKTGLEVRTRSEEYTLSYKKRHPSKLTVVTDWERGFIEGLYLSGFNGVEIQKFLILLWGRRLDTYSILEDAKFPLDSPSIAGKKRFSRLVKNGKKTFRNYTSQQTKPEIELGIILDEVCLNQYKYTGRGEIWIGNRNPDFFNVDGQKKVIEMFGDHWHQGDNPNNRINHFKEYGYDCLVIWESELENRNEVKERIKDFNEK